VTPLARALAERDEAMELVTDLRAEVDGWKRRAQVLYDACNPDLRDDVLGTLQTIEGLPEVAG
jgi:hypothetical protein